MREAALSAYLIMTRGSVQMESPLSKQTCQVLTAWGEAVRAPFEFQQSFQEWQF